MSESEGLVTDVKGDFAVIEVAAAASACGKCGDKGACGKAANGPRRYAVRNTVGARPGDRVVLSVPDGAVLKAAALSYLMPVLFSIGGAAAGTAWGGEGLAAVAGAVLGLMTGVAILRMTAARFACGREPWLALRLQRHVIHFDKEA